jgi:uncharacterized 2Fe-2S/4Fe-4S cluster protein (DUF4445 family)
MSKQTVFQIDWQPVGRRVESQAGRSLLEAAQSAGIELAAVCGGDGICGTCRVRLMRGEATPVTPEEQALFSHEELAQGYRLACRAFPRSDITLDIPPDSLTAPQRLQLESKTIEIKPDAVERTAFGLAVDIGTTKLAAYLLDLRAGRTLAQAGAMNPQIAYGEDVISRIAYANAHTDGRQILQACLVETLNQLVRELCVDAAIEREQIVKAVVVGNTAMHHLFAGLPVRQLGEAPYLPATREALEIAARDVGLQLAPKVHIYMPPIIAGFVGTDHVAMILSTGLWQPGRTRLALDIGTNTEISLAAGGQLWSCSCASGPVFEGAHIRDGMRAAPGAIERVQIIHGNVHFQTINHLPPAGLCGSGILDVVAELYKADLLDAQGRLRHARGDKGFVLVPASAAGHHHNIVVTRRDVHEVQLAKAAIRAGTEILLRRAGLSASEVDEVIIAGAFGSYLDVNSAIRIGMFLPLPRDRFRQVGNAAGAGARQLLLSAAQRQLAAEIARRVEYIELTTQPDFTNAYVAAMHFEGDTGCAPL